MVKQISRHGPNVQLEVRFLLGLLACMSEAWRNQLTRAYMTVEKVRLIVDKKILRLLHLMPKRSSRVSILYVKPTPCTILALVQDFIVRW